MPEPQYCVVALFEPLAVGATFPRAEWPAHVTLASNFRVAGPVDRVLEAVCDVAIGAFALRVGDAAMFGPRHDVPARLLEAPGIHEAHAALAERLSALEGFTPAEPAFWRNGYRPHLTVRPSCKVGPGDVLTASHIAVAKLDGASAEIIWRTTPRAAALQGLVAAIARVHEERGHPIVVGISGYGGSGKSTLARELVAHVPGSVRMRGDDFLDPIRSHHRSTDWDGVDRQRLVRDVLQPFRTRQPSEFQRFDWGTRALAPAEPVPQGDVMIVDLVGLFHPEALDALDLTVWCDVDLATAHERGARRDADAGHDHAHLWRDVWVPNDAAFDTHFAPRERADIIVPTGGS